MVGIIAGIDAQPDERTAILVGDTPVTFARFRRDIAAAAVLFAEQGIDEGTTVGVRAGPLPSGQTYASWVAHLALIRLGCRHVSMVELASVADTLKAQMLDVVVGSKKTLDRVPATMRRIAFDISASGPAAVPGIVPPNNEDRARRLNLTSGTTGTPKFLEWDSTMLQKRVEQVADGVAIGPDTLQYNLLHLRTTSGFRYPIAVWQQGGCVLLPDDEDPRARDEAALFRCNLLACSPPQLEDRLQAFREPWPGKQDRSILVLGGRLPKAVKEQALDRACAALSVSYGSTETGSVAIGDASLTDRHPGAVGFVRDGVEVRTVDVHGQQTPPGQPGQLMIRSNLMVGSYLGADGRIANPNLVDGWFKPGDVAILHEDGMLAIEGRESDTFNVGGWKVNAPDLEAKLAFLPGVVDLCALVMPLDDGDLLTFALACRDDADLDKVAGMIKARLPRGTKFHVVRLKAIPRNEMGKIPRTLIAKRLTELYGARKANLSNA